MDLANEVNKSFSRLWHSLLWPVGELELPHGSGLPVLQNESHTPNHRGGRQEDSDSAQAIKAGMIFSKTGKKKLETCLTRKSVTFISYLLLTLSTFHIYLNCKLIYSHNAQLKTRILKKNHLILILGNASEPQRLSSKPKWNKDIPFQNFQNPITSYADRNIQASRPDQRFCYCHDTVTSAVLAYLQHCQMTNSDTERI